MINNRSCSKANALSFLECVVTRLALATALLVLISSSGTVDAFAPPSVPNRHQHHRHVSSPMTHPSRGSSGSSSTARHALAVDAAVQGFSQFSNTASAAYAYCLQAYQIPTQMATFGAFSATGDAIAQNVAALTTTEDDDAAQNAASEDSSSTSYDPERTFRYLLKGLGGGIMWSFWYGTIDPWALQLAQASLASLDHLGVMTVGADDYEALEQPARIVSAIVLEQFVASPLAYTFWDIPVPAMLSGQSTTPQEVVREIRHKLGTLLWANAKVWTPVNVVTYSLPAEWRLLFVSAMELMWQVVNSQITSQPAEDAEEEAKQATSST